MKILNVGPDKLGEYELESLNKNRPLDVSLARLIYSYERGAWDGDGVAIYQDSNGYWHTDGLGHCSCYGAFDDGWNGITYTLDQVKHILEKCGNEHDKRVLKALEKKIWR